MIPCSTYEFRDEPAEVLEKVLVQDAEVLVCSPEDLVRTGRTRPVAVLMSIARYERYAEIEAQLRELGRAFAESN